jgi:outer membrane protein OmpA-like peptidoglycan-associated protein
MKAIIVISLVFASIYTSLAQNPTFSQPESSLCKIRLPEIINAHRPTILPVLSPDGKRLYFDRKQYINNIGNYKDPDDIWYSDRKSGYWTEPQNAEIPINSRGSDVLFSITPDGKRALLYGAYPNMQGKIDTGFAIAQWNGLRWSKPQRLNIKNYKNKNFSFYGNLSAHETVLLLAIETQDSRGDLDIYVSFLNEFTNEWSEPMNLGDDINSGSLELSPYVARDGKTLYFSSDRTGGFGSDDLYMAKRLDETWKKWSKPVNLGSRINTARSENSISLTSSGDTACIISSSKESDIEGIYFVCLHESVQPTKEKFMPKREYIAENIYFASNSSQPTPAELQKISAIFSALQTTKGEIYIDGYADDIGSDDYNKTLSEKRAEYILDFLKKNNINAVMRLQAFGNELVRGKNLTDEEKAKQRRVDITVKFK